MKEKPSKLDPYAERLDEWFGLQKLTLAAVQEQLRLDGLEVSLQRLSDWWAARSARHLQTRLLGQIASGSRECKEVEKAFGQDPPPELETLIKLHRVLIMKLSTMAVADPELLSLASGMMKPMIAYAKVQEQAKSRELDERKLALLERKAAELDHAKEVMASPLTAEEKQQKMKALFGIT